MINLLLVLLTKFLLDLLFALYVEPIFGYEPYLAPYGTFNPEKWFIASAITGLLWLFIRALNTSGMRISSFYILTQFFVIIIPYLVLFGMQDRPYFHIVLLVGAFTLLNVIVGLSPHIIIPPPPKTVAYSLVAIGAACCAYIYVGLIATGGLGRLNFNLYSVYETRSEYQNAMMPGFGYLVSWVAYVINMTFLIFFFSKKKWLYVVATLIAQLALFGMTNFKSFLFAPVAALGIAIARQYFVLPRLLLLGIIAAISLGTVVHMAGEIMGISIIRRALFVPAALHGLYFDYFSSAPLGLMAGTRFAELFGSTYDETAVNIIARLFWGEDISPNVGWIGDAFAQFSWLGVFIYTILFSFFLKLADSLVAHLDPRNRAIEGLLVGSAFALCSSGLTSTLLTHGFLILLLALWTLSYFDGKDSKKMAATCSDIARTRISSPSFLRRSHHDGSVPYRR